MENRPRPENKRRANREKRVVRVGREVKDLHGSAIKFCRARSKMGNDRFVEIFASSF